jgi:hypothetical protein
MTLKLRRHAAPAALLISLLTLVASFTGLAGAAKKAALPGASVTPKPFGILRLDKRGRFPARVIPKVAAARSADRLGGQRAEDLTGNCNAQSVDLGTWCLLASPYAVPNEDVGKNTYFYASQTCAELGGYLPTAAQLVGAANRVKLASTITDSRLTASIDQDATDGLKDRREMSATLVTTAAGSSAAGSMGVTEGSRGDPKQGEPDPVPFPANPSPETLQYVTVYDNRNKGGFAGSKPVGQPENFRCAFEKEQGPPRELE